jgi:hypothetical protein
MQKITEMRRHDEALVCIDIFVLSERVIGEKSFSGVRATKIIFSVLLYMYITLLQSHRTYPSVGIFPHEFIP